MIHCVLRSSVFRSDKNFLQSSLLNIVINSSYLIIQAISQWNPLLTVPPLHLIRLYSILDFPFTMVRNLQPCKTLSTQSFHEIFPFSNSTLNDSMENAYEMESSNEVFTACIAYWNCSFQPSTLLRALLLDVTWFDITSLSHFLSCFWFVSPSPHSFSSSPSIISPPQHLSLLNLTFLSLLSYLYSLTHPLLSLTPTSLSTYLAISILW